MWNVFVTIQVNKGLTANRELTDLISNSHQFDLDFKDLQLWKVS
jgi:hypothetical protein